ncbi:MAG: protein phosphatase 2C domain-containing protein [Lachnospiraceae bacterium]|nr:protein phosphatase 2C domain-containing protein [Lachnospiraceae bacterium]
MIYSAIYTDQGGRPENEDSARLLRQGPDVACAVVADGLGGHGGGRIASDTAVRSLCASWDGSGGQEELKTLIEKANQDVLSRQSSVCAMKSTIVALSLVGRRAVWAHVGDSRLYRFYEKRLEFQTRDHSASQVAVMLGDITPDQIRFHEDRNRVLRALGQEEEMKVETGELSLQSGSYAFLLCTDGFWEYVLEPEMEEDLKASHNPEEWLDRMKRRLWERVPPDNDNNTALAVWLEP